MVQAEPGDVLLTGGQPGQEGGQNPAQTGGVKTGGKFDSFSDNNYADNIYLFPSDIENILFLENNPVYEENFFFSFSCYFSSNSVGIAEAASASQLIAPKLRQRDRTAKSRDSLYICTHVFVNN